MSASPAAMKIVRWIALAGVLFTLGTFNGSGRVADLRVDVRDTVEQGALLVQLDSPQLKAALIAARAARAVAYAGVAVAFEFASRRRASIPLSR